MRIKSNASACVMGRNSTIYTTPNSASQTAAPRQIAGRSHHEVVVNVSGAFVVCPVVLSAMSGDTIALILLWKSWIGLTDLQSGASASPPTRHVQPNNGFTGSPQGALSISKMALSIFTIRPLFVLRLLHVRLRRLDLATYRWSVLYSYPPGYMDKPEALQQSL